jgi:NAD(P)H-hydrate epimerase
MHALTRAEVRAFDRRCIEQLGVPGIVLMENAGRGVADVLRSLGIRGRVTICCGKGNNGGDGFVIARHLTLYGHNVRIFLFASLADLKGDALTNYVSAARLGLPIAVSIGESAGLEMLRNELAESEWVVDALFGTGLEGAVRPPFDAIIQQINASPAKVLAVDIPSGLDCDTGEPLGPTVEAEHTVTFVALKKGFLNPSSRKWTGQIHVADIGGEPWGLSPRS